MSQQNNKTMKKEAINYNGIDLYEYTSVDELLQDVKDREKYTEGKRLSSIKSKEYFSMSKSYEHMLEIVSSPVEFTDYISEKIKDLDIKEVVEEVVTTYDVAGSYADVGLYLSGEPECMVEFTSQPVHNKFATIVVSLGESGFTEADKIHAKAVMLYAIVANLESQGIRTRVYLALPVDAKGDYNNFITTLCVKDYNQNLEVNQISAVHVSFIRRAYFAFIEKYAPNLIDDGYGRPGELQGKYLQAITEHYNLHENVDRLIILDRFSNDYLLEQVCGDLTKESIEYYIKTKINNEQD